MPDAAHIPPAASGSYPVRSGNAVRPLVDGEPAFRRICEAVEAAEHSVWVTVAFFERAFQMPDDRGSFFDVLDRAAERGIDVRVVFWSEPEVERQIAGTEHFPASSSSHEFLQDRSSGVLIRWDRVADHCHHQKSWLVDAGHETEVAFVGGINLDRGSMVGPDHPHDPARPENVHDIYVEIRGPAASDVMHNFVQRWNEASERELPEGAYPDLESASPLEFPRVASPAAGDVPVQITRSVLPDLYSDGTASPGGDVYEISKGEASVLEQYLAAIDNARHTIYFENQLLLCPKTMIALRGALERGVDVVALVPNQTMPEVVQARSHPRAKPVFDLLASLGEFEGFTFAALTAYRGPGEYEDIYVHAKFAAVDDSWATIGSTNTMFRSFQGDTEMNASFWSEPVVRSLRCELLREHLQEDTERLTDRDAFALYREIALANAQARERGEPLRGQVFAIDPASWAT